MLIGRDLDEAALRAGFDRIAAPLQLGWVNRPVRLT
jgi:hypothetical protein